MRLPPEEVLHVYAEVETVDGGGFADLDLKKRREGGGEERENEGRCGVQRWAG
jgi:hypothetical protein